MVEASTLTFVGIIIVGVLTAFGAILGHTAKRITEIEAEQRELESYNDELWVYTRFLLDLYYRWRTVEAPDPNLHPHLVLNYIIKA